MTGVVDVGGGLRGIYGAGVLDYCLEHGIQFDYCIGVSAGSANLASYLGKQKGRNYRFYTKYASRRQYMGIRNLFSTGSYLGLDYIYGQLSQSGGEDPLDFKELENSKSVMKVVALNALTGKAVYFDKSDMRQDQYDILKASSCLPLACRPYWIDGIPYYDGGLADPVPLKKAFEDGCEKAVVILSKPLNFVRTQKKDIRAARLLGRKYPKAAESLLDRYRKYNDGVAFARESEKAGRALLIAPASTCGLKTLTKNKILLDRMYREGYSDAAALNGFLKSGNFS